MSVIKIDIMYTDDGPYTVTTGSMLWNTSNFNDRRTVSDKYRCEAKHYVGINKSSVAWVDIQCTYSNQLFVIFII